MRSLDKTDALVRRRLLSSRSSAAAAAWHKLIPRAREEDGPRGERDETEEGAAVVGGGGDANFSSKSDLAGAINKTGAAAVVTHLIRRVPSSLSVPKWAGKRKYGNARRERKREWDGRASLSFPSAREPFRHFNFTGWDAFKPQME